MDTKRKSTSPAGTTTRKKAAEQAKSRSSATKHTKAPDAGAKQRANAPGRTAERRHRPAATKPRQARRNPSVEREIQSPAPDVVYMPATPFNRNRLLLQLVSAIAVVLALVFGVAIFFKVDQVTVSGTNKYSVNTILEASGISEGDNLLGINKAKISGKIIAALPYVESVRIGIKLPDTVHIEIKELDVVYSIRDSSDFWWLITAEGKVVEKVDSAVAGDYTKILGVVLEAPETGKQAVAQELQETTDAAGATLPVVVRGSDKLKAALDIVQYMEFYGIIGEAASVDVDDLGNMELWYGQRFQVKLGNTTQLKYKIQCMDSAINGPNGLREYDSGILDISFFVDDKKVIYEPFS